MVYNGHYWQTIDAENRVELPGAIRQVSDSSQYVITRGLKACLLLYPIERWKKMQTEVVTLNDPRGEVRHFYRRVLMWALDTAADENGRIEIPSKLREVADLDQRVLLLGADTHVELWDPSRLEEDLDEKAERSAQYRRRSD